MNWKILLKPILLIMLIFIVLLFFIFNINYYSGVSLIFHDFQSVPLILIILLSFFFGTLTAFFIFILNYRKIIKNQKPDKKKSPTEKEEHSEKTKANE